MKKFFAAMLLGLLMFSVTPAQAQTEFNFDLNYNKQITNFARYGWSDAWVVRCNEWITLRDRPSVYGDSLARMPLGSHILVQDGYYENGFYYVEYRGMHGYALASYISF